MGTWLHSVGSWVGRQLGTADTGTIPPPTHAQITSLIGPPRHHLDPTQDHILSQVFSPPYQGPLELDRYGSETPEMRHRFRTLYRTSPVLRSAVRGKADDICCLQPTLMPADKDDALSALAAKFVDWTVTASPGGWAGLLDTVYTAASIDGWSVSEKTLRPAVWKGRPVWGLAQVRGIDTTHLRLQLDPYLNVVGVVNVLRGLEFYRPEQVILYSHNGLYGNPFGQSDVRAATRAAEIISDVYKVWYVALKVYGLPYMKGKVSDPSRRKHMEAALRALRDGGWVVLPSKEDEIEVLNLSAAAALSGFEQMVHAQREDIFFAVRGAAQPFMEGDGGASAHTDTSVQQEASNAGEQRLAGALADVINRQLIPWLVGPNFALPEDRMPRLKLGGTNWGNVKAIVGIIKDAQGVGLEVSAEWAHEATGMPAPRDPQDRLVSAQEKQQQQQPGPGGADGGRDGGNDGAALSAGHEPEGRHAFAAPGPPPRPGLVWKEETHRWIHPETHEEFEHVPGGAAVRAGPSPGPVRGEGAEPSGPGAPGAAPAEPPKAEGESAPGAAPAEPPKAEGESAPPAPPAEPPKGPNEPNPAGAEEEGGGTEADEVVAKKALRKELDQLGSHEEKMAHIAAAKGIKSSTRAEAAGTVLLGSDAVWQETVDPPKSDPPRTTVGMGHDHRSDDGRIVRLVDMKTRAAKASVSIPDRGRERASKISEYLVALQAARGAKPPKAVVPGYIHLGRDGATFVTGYPRSDEKSYVHVDKLNKKPGAVSKKAKKKPEDDDEPTGPEKEPAGELHDDFETWKQAVTARLNKPDDLNTPFPALRLHSGLKDSNIGTWDKGAVSSSDRDAHGNPTSARERYTAATEFLNTVPGYHELVEKQARA
ncbi:MAG TPA: DUF935 family protein, partial [Gemmata sp.]